MKRFSFRLDKLLRLKRETEDELAQKLSEVLRAAEEKRIRASDSATRKWEAEQQMARLRTEPVPAGALSAAEQALRAVRGQAEKDAREHRTAIAQVEKEQVRFQAARQERKSLERLRERKHSEWMSRLNRMEQAELDEVAGRMMRSKRKGIA